MTLSKGLSSLISKLETPTGLITEIQRYSIKDGPGIRTTVFMKGCTLECSWCSNPEAISPHPELLINHRLCVHCGDCVPVCPTHAFTLVDATLDFNRELCDACGDCVSCCPEGALEIVGRGMSLEQVVDEVLRDEVFYQVSEGGVTFSGGEPLLQPGFIGSVTEQLHDKNVHIGIDTAGNVPWDSFEMVLPYTNLFLYDLKFIEGAKHEHFTGVENRMILENAQKIAESGVAMIVRMVIIPGVNDSLEEFRGMTEFVQSLKVVEQIDLLPYHKLGMAKYARLGKSYLHNDLKTPDKAHLEALRKMVEEGGFRVTVGG
jgi:pyruvate formate lyase activating enzyme